NFSLALSDSSDSHICGSRLRPPNTGLDTESPLIHCSLTANRRDSPLTVMENCMRSAETSGAVANGFGAANGIAETRQPQDASPANRWTVHLDFSPITATVALTSLLAVLLF